MNLEISELEVRCIQVALHEYREKAQDRIGHWSASNHPKNKALMERFIKVASDDIDALGFSVSQPILFKASQTTSLLT